MTIVKNYLDKEHMRRLGRLVNSFLDLAEDRAERAIVMNMKDWVGYLDKFLDLSDYPILTHAGKVPTLEAKLKAETEYEKFRVEQDRNYISDFDIEVEKYLKQSEKK